MALKRTKPGSRRPQRQRRLTAGKGSPVVETRARPRHPRIGFIGAGNMARALAGGLIDNGWDKSRIALSDPDPLQRRTIAQALGVSTYEDNKDVAAHADILVLAVKPQILSAVARALAPALHGKRPLVISIAAGIQTADIQRWLGEHLPIVRVMPNTPALVGSSASALFANSLVSASMRTQAESVLRSVGVIVWLPDEGLMDVVTAVAGSGPAYFLLIMECLEQAAVAGGLAPPMARLLILETALGSAKMALELGEDPSVLRSRVTSPGGTTEKAIQILQQGRIQDLFHEATQAATARARELGQRYGKSG